MKCGTIYFTSIYYCYMFLFSFLSWFSFWCQYYTTQSYILTVSPSVLYNLRIWECWKIQYIFHPPAYHMMYTVTSHVQTSLLVHQGLAEWIALPISLVCQPNCPFTTPVVLTYTVFPVDTGTLLWLWGIEDKNITVLQNVSNSSPVDILWHPRKHES
jgi:hypothetical protein